METYTHKNLIVYCLTVGQMASHCYLIADKDTHDTVIVDAGDDGTYIVETVQRFELVPQYIVATHGHFDHIMGTLEVQSAFDIPFYVHPKDTFLVDRMAETAKHFLGIQLIDPPPVIHGDIPRPLKINSSILQVIETPGHTPGSIALYSESDGFMVVGDTIFADGNVGRTDFSYSSPNDLYASIKTLFRYPLQTVVYAGHGDLTTIAQTRNIEHKLV